MRLKCLLVAALLAAISPLSTLAAPIPQAVDATVREPKAASSTSQTSGDSAGVGESSPGEDSTPFDFHNLKSLRVYFDPSKVTLQKYTLPTGELSLDVPSNLDHPITKKKETRAFYQYESSQPGISVMIQGALPDITGLDSFADHFISGMMSRRNAHKSAASGEKPGDDWKVTKTPATGTGWKGIKIKTIANNGLIINSLLAEDTQNHVVYTVAFGSTVDSPVYDKMLDSVVIYPDKVAEAMKARAEATADKYQWSKFAPENGEFSVSLPKPIFDGLTTNKLPEVTRYQANADGIIFQLQRTAQPVKADSEFTDMTTLVTGMLKQKMPNAEFKQENIQGDGWTGQKLRVQFNGRTIMIMLFALSSKEKIAYTLAINGSEDNALTNKVLSSFTVAAK